MPDAKSLVAGAPAQEDVELDAVEKIANAVLYEGYILYPYRADAVKNRQRFNFGALYPTAHSQSQAGADTDTMEIECLVSCDESSDAFVEARIRFLHLLSREVSRLLEPIREPPQRRGQSHFAPSTAQNRDSPRRFSDSLLAPSAVDETVTEADFEAVDSLVIDGRLHQTWQEAVERDILFSGISLVDLVARPLSRSFSLPASRVVEPLYVVNGALAGRITRRQKEITGLATFSAERLAIDLYKLRVVVTNTTPLAAAALTDRDELLLSAFISTHALLRVAGGEFLSLLEPPDALRSVAATCRNVAAWPVLVGEVGKRDRMLASPIILYDYPQVAPESSGDWCDGGEIDEMLALRVMTLTDDEKQAMRDVDPRAREILERAESMTDEQMRKLHGAFCGLERSETRRAGEGLSP